MGNALNSGKTLAMNVERLGKYHKRRDLASRLQLVYSVEMTDPITFEYSLQTITLYLGNRY